MAGGGVIQGVRKVGWAQRPLKRFWGSALEATVFTPLPLSCVTWGVRDLLWLSFLICKMDTIQAASCLPGLSG